MTKVEELRETIVACVADSKAILSHQVAEQFVDSLIAAAREEGFEKRRAEGAEEARPKIAASTERLIQWILDMMPPYEGANPEWGRKVLLDLVATAAEQERERIRKAADHYQAEDECFAAQLVDGNYVGASYEMYVVSPSLLAPAPKEEGE